MPVSLCGAFAFNVVVKVKWCYTGAPQSNTSSVVDWTDCWWIAVRWQWVHMLWGMFAIRPTSETDGLLIGCTGHRGLPGSMKRIGAHKCCRIGKPAAQLPPDTWLSLMYSTETRCLPQLWHWHTNFLLQFVKATHACCTMCVSSTILLGPAGFILTKKWGNSHLNVGT